MDTIAFIGGGNMARAIIGGLLADGRPAQSLLVVDPSESQRSALERDFGLRPLAAAGAELGAADVVVWAVKPQGFGAAATPCAPHVGRALQLSVMAGIRSDAIVRATGSERVVRAMPNTPALIGQGIAGLYARPAVGGAERTAVETVLAPTGRLLWVDDEADLDTVTALSGSGPAYVFYLAEALVDAAGRLGLAVGPAREFALATISGAAALAAGSDEPLGTLRERVTSKGGTTHAALTVLEDAGVKAAVMRAVEAAHRRAGELGDEFDAA